MKLKAWLGMAIGALVVLGGILIYALSGEVWTYNEAIFAYALMVIAILAGALIGELWDEY